MGVIEPRGRFGASRLGQSARQLARTPSRWVVVCAGLLFALVMSGCASNKFTVDDGRMLDPVLLGQIRAYGQGERAVRPAIVRSAALNDAECDKQWELPFSVASSQSWAENDRVAWVRALGVDERLTVVAAVAESPLQVGERIVAVDGKRHDNDAEALLELIAERRDDGKSFVVLTSAARKVDVRPFQVCRGYTRFAPPNTPALQDYHWLLSMHPLELAQAGLDDDQALWLVLWTQGLSEEGGARMKTYHYGTKIVGTLYNVVTLATGLNAAALAASTAVKAAQAAATQLATDILRQQLIEQAKAYAVEQIRGALADAAGKLVRATVVNSMQQAAINRGALSGVSRVAATVFERADAWAFGRMAKLQANPLAGFGLHRRLAEAGLAANAMVFDVERLDELTRIAEKQGLQAEVVATLKGLKPSDLLAEISAMPLASAPGGFSWDDPADQAGGPYAFGLVAAMLEMPVSGGRAEPAAGTRARP